MHGWAASMQLIWFYATFHTLFSFYPSLSLSVSPSSTLYIQIKLGTGWSERFYFTSRITLIFKIFTRGLNSTRTFQITLHIHTDMKLKLKCKSIGKTAKKMKKNTQHICTITILTNMDENHYTTSLPSTYI